MYVSATLNKRLFIYFIYSFPSCPEEDLQEVILHDPPSTNVEPPSPPPPRSFLGSFSSFLSNVLRK